MEQGFEPERSAVIHICRDVDAVIEDFVVSLPQEGRLPRATWSNKQLGTRTGELGDDCAIVTGCGCPLTELVLREELCPFFEHACQRLVVWNSQPGPHRPPKAHDLP